jgi:hypothetical protein
MGDIGRFMRHAWRLMRDREIHEKYREIYVGRQCKDGRSREEIGKYMGIRGDADEEIQGLHEK